MDDEIKIQKAWLESLLRYAQWVEDEILKLSDEKRIELIQSTSLHALLGFISSAETILKLYPHDK